MSVKRLAFVACVAALSLAWPSSESAHARPQYLKGFSVRYPSLSAAKSVKCAVCHCVTSKKALNNYGRALKEEFGQAKNVKDVAQIDQGLFANESKPSHFVGKTFGDLIAEGQLPGEPCPAPPKRPAVREP